ncbi:ionotropic receptor 75a-like [Arctopsyche grandis]|uniref:ionotropic receptor 75a-like n=1 Tax=Arctopsyche grandis TaxID=121162 RepID=UPI00406D9059
MHRYGYNIYLILMEMFNFKIKIVRTNTWGTLKNGSWTGVMGALTNHQAEVSVTPLQFKIERMGFIDSTSIIYLCRCRLVTIVILVFTFLLYQFYSASIVSSLLMEPPRTIKNVNDIIKSNFVVLIEDIAYNYYEFFDSTANPYAKNLYRKKILVQGTKNSYVNANYGLKKVNEGDHAFYIDIDTAYKIISENFNEQSVCDLGEVTVLPPRRIQFVTRKGSPYREMIAYGLRKIHETGVMQYHTLIWHTSKPKCAPSGSKQTFNITIVDTATAFLILVTGFITSLLILFIELCSNYLQKRNFHPEN